jgi:hypothetical protein
LEHVGANDFEARLSRELQMEVLGQERVYLDRHHAPGARQQLFGESTAAGADFNHQILLRGTRRRRDALEDRSPDEEVLSESRAWHANAVSPAR